MWSVLCSVEFKIGIDDHIRLMLSSLFDLYPVAADAFFFRWVVPFNGNTQLYSLPHDFLRVRESKMPQKMLKAVVHIHFIRLSNMYIVYHKTTKK
jgi:hypothetical protein